MDTLVVEDLHKRYGEREVVKGISFSVKEGEIFGLIGPNGAGKTTPLRMISTLLRVTSGRAYLQFMANFFANGDEAKAMVEKGIALSKLGDRIDSKVDTYSKGMMRRLLIARAIMPGPRFAIMDEVTSGLDVMNAYEIRDVIREIARQGVTVLISSHNMFEVDLLCDRIAMINNGELILEGVPSELKERFGVATVEEVFVKAVNG